MLKGTRRLCHSHRLVSAPLERRGSSGIDAAGLEPPTQPILVSPVPSQETYRRGGFQSDGLGDEHDSATPPDGNVLSSPVPWVGAPRGSCGEQPAPPACEDGDFPTAYSRALSPPRVPLREAFETIDKLKRRRSRVPLHRGSLLAFFGCAATLAAFGAVCDRVAWSLSLTAFVICFDAATRLGTARVPT